MDEPLDLRVQRRAVCQFDQAVGVAGYVKRRRALLLLAALVAGCDGPMQEISDPFYVGSVEAGGEPWLFRCIDGAGQSCANDSLPDGRVLRAGGNSQFIAFEMERGFYYFRRVGEERRGWGNNPEVIVGPLDEARFAAITRAIGLPELAAVE